MPVVLLHPKSFAGSAWGRPRNFSTGGASGSYPDFAIIAEEVNESRGFCGAGYRKSNPDLCKNTKAPIIGGRSGPSSGRNPRRGKRTGRGQRVYSLKRKPACLSSGFAPLALHVLTRISTFTSRGISPSGRRVLAWSLRQYVPSGRTLCGSHRAQAGIHPAGSGSDAGFRTRDPVWP